jgi:hypothetical protein
MQDEGTLVLFLALTDEASEHVRQQIQPEPWQMVGTSFAVDHRLAFDMRVQLEDDGFTVQ